MKKIIFFMLAAIALVFAQSTSEIDAVKARRLGAPTAKSVRTALTFGKAVFGTAELDSAATADTVLHADITVSSVIIFNWLDQPGGINADSIYVEVKTDTFILHTGDNAGDTRTYGYVIH